MNCTGAALFARRVDGVLLRPARGRQLGLLDGDGARAVQRGDAEGPAVSKREYCVTKFYGHSIQIE